MTLHIPEATLDSLANCQGGVPTDEDALRDLAAEIVKPAVAAELRRLAEVVAEYDGDDAGVVAWMISELLKDRAIYLAEPGDV